MDSSFDCMDCRGISRSEFGSPEVIGTSHFDARANSTHVNALSASAEYSERSWRHFLAVKIEKAGIPDSRAIYSGRSASY